MNLILTHGRMYVVEMDGIISSSMPNTLMVIYIIGDDNCVLVGGSVSEEWGWDEGDGIWFRFKYYGCKMLDHLFGDELSHSWREPDHPNSVERVKMEGIVISSSPNTKMVNYNLR